MSDLVTRLRAMADCNDGDNVSGGDELREAAARIAELEAEVARLRGDRDLEKRMRKDADSYREEVIVERDAALARAEVAERAVKSLAVMLGWGNVPPRESLEANLRALKARAEQAEANEEGR